jgi:quinol monooxygenase YgiN
LGGTRNLHFDSALTPGPVATVVSVFKIREGYEQLFIEELSRLVRTSREEVGCLLFDAYRVAARSSVFALHEVWVMREAMEAHARNFHTARFRMTVDKYLAHPMETLELEELI